MLLRVTTIPKIRLGRISGNLSRECLLAIHMFRSEKHTSIFPIVEDISSTSTVTGKAIYELRHMDEFCRTFLRMFVGEGFLYYYSKSDGNEIGTYYKIIQDESFKLKYITHKDITKQDIDLSEAVPVYIFPEYKYVGKITNEKEIMIQSLSDKGKISFKLSNKSSQEEQYEDTSK